MFNFRQLKKEEYSRLLELSSDIKEIPNEYCDIIVAEDDDKIIGFWVIQPMIVTEPVWISPEYRNGTVGNSMFKKVIDLVKKRKINEVYIHSDDHVISNYLSRLGFKNTGWVAFRKVVK